MERFDVVVIGGGTAGVTCAISALNTYPEKKIAVIRKEPIALIPCDIPYTLKSLNSVDDDILPDSLINNIGADLIIDEVMSRDGNILLLKSSRRIQFTATLLLKRGRNLIS